MSNYLKVPETNWDVKNKGTKWTFDDYAALIEHFVAGFDIAHIGRCRGRTALAVCAQLENFRLVQVEADGLYGKKYRLLPAEKLLERANRALGKLEYGELDMDYVGRANVAATTQPETQPEIKEQIMNAPVIETKTFIAGVEASLMSDDHIFAKIAELEVMAEKLSKIQNKPKKLAAKIEGIHADIKKLVAYVDER